METMNWKATDLGSLVAELERQKETKVDFIADTRQLRVETFKDAETWSIKLVPDSAQTSEWLPSEGLTLSPNAIGQIVSTRTPSVPVRFFRSLLEIEPVIAAELVTDLMHAQPKRQLIRCLDNRVRAVLSDSYRVIDNYDVAFSALEAVKANDGVVLRCGLSESRMSLAFTRRDLKHRLEEESRGRGAHESFSVSRGVFDDDDTGPGWISPYGVVSNSETGSGGYSCMAGLCRRACVNGVLVVEVMKQIHLGSKLEEGLFRPETRAAEAQATILKCQDAVSGLFSEEVWRKIVDQCEAANRQPIHAPTAAVDNVVKGLGLSDKTREDLLEHFLSDYEKTRYGLAQAIARTAQDQEGSDEVAELETAAGTVLGGAFALA